MLFPEVTMTMMEVLKVRLSGGQTTQMVEVDKKGELVTREVAFGNL